MKIKNLLTTALLLLGVSTASATITSGYYRIKNNAYEGRYIGENTLEHTLPTSTDISSTDYTYVWYLDVDGTNVTIKNAVTGRYVQRLNNLSDYYETNTTPATFTLDEPSTGVFTFTDTKNNGLHCSSSQSYFVVRWSTSDEHNKWIVESADVDNEALTTQQAAFAEASTSQLTTFFTTTACTDLNDTYKSYSDDALRTAMSALPTSVQDLAVKVKNNSWATYAGWDKTEETFRIADYKAYSSSSRWTSIMGLKYQYAQLENPTGIYVSSGNYLQIYVGSIPTGETVKLAIAGYGAGGYEGTPIVTYTLHEGMNVMQARNDGNCFVIYEVDNTTDGSTQYKLLSTYNDVTVHIEGGTVQGYFDLTKGDDNDDWTQLKANLMSENMFCMKTKTLTFNLQTDLIKTAVDGGGGEGSTGKMVEMLEYWQSIEDMEDEIFNRTAIADFTYCNNIHTVTTIGNEGDSELYAFTNGIYFSPEQHNRLFNNKLFREGNDNLWASAHELGHHRQEPINMAGNTEVSNNLYSNVAVYQQGHYTSRTASIQMTFDDFQESLSWPERVKNACDGVSNYNQQLLHLNWQLYQFFHINGNKTDFFPLLFSALRADPMVKTTGEDNLTLANNDYLKYYVKCCTVSGYDLTEFFEAYGFFKLPPVQGNSKTYNDVTTSYYTTFDDYGTYNLGVTQGMIDAAKAAVAALSLPKCNIIFIEDRVSAPDATYEGHSVGEKKLLNPDAPVSAFGEVGETGQYTTFGVTPSAYTYNVTARGTVKMVGTGAVGFIVYDNTDNHIVGFYNTYTFNLPYGTSNYTIKAAAGDGTVAAATLDASIAVEDFPKSNTWYTFASKSDTGRFVESKGAGSGLVGTQTLVSTSAMHWKFVLRDGETETFDIVNRDDNSYVSPTASNDTQISTTTAQPATGWKIRAVGDYYTICSGSCQFNQTGIGHSYQLYNWGSGVTTNDNNCLFKIQEAADGIYIADGTTTNGPSTYGDAQSGSLDNSKLHNTWVSKAASGHAGVTLSASHKAFMEETSYSSKKYLGFKPSAGNATDILNITAPVGYKIVGYYLEAGYWTSSENYTLTASEGTGTTTYTTSAAPSDGTVGLNVTGINKRRTAISVKSNQSANSKCLMINRFWVFLTTDEEVISAAPNLVGRLVTDENQIVSGKPYFVRYVGDGRKSFVKDINNGNYYQVTKDDDIATPNSIYYFYNNGDGTWKLKNYETEKWWGALPGTTATSYLPPVEEASAASWTLNFNDEKAFPKDGTKYLTRSSEKLHGWASNSNSGFEIYEAEAVSALSGLSDLTGDNWYRIQISAPAGYAGISVENNTNEKNYNGTDRYPLTYQSAASIPYVGDAINYVRVIRDGDNIHMQSANGHYLDFYAKASLSEQDINVAYSGGFQLGSYFTVFVSGGDERIIGKGSGTGTRFALYPIDYSEEGLNAWNFILVGSDDDYQQITCNRTDVSGLNTIYSGGYFFLPKGVVPAVSDFNINGVTNYDVNTTTKTITATIDPSLSLQVKDVAVIQGNQTTGKGNTMQALLRVKVTPFYDCDINKFSVTLTGAEQLDNVAVYTTTNDELQAEGASPTKISSDIAAAASVDIPVTQAMTADQSLYFWITGDVKSTATEWETIDAAVTAISYTNAYTTAHSMDAISCDLSSIGDPDGEMRIYKQQQFLWTSSTTTNKYYRIPTIMKTANGGIVALADYRHDHPNDLGKTASNGYGGHIIDVVSRSNADCGDTWESEVKVAVGDGTNDASYGYGDPAIVRDNDGTLHCLMAAGSKSYAKGMLHMGYSKSTDNGASWSAVTDIYSSIDKGSLTITSAFTTGGKGVTFENGRMAFAFLGTVSSSTNIYPIYSDDKGATWKLGTTAAYSGGDEAKFEIMNDYSLLASVKIVSYNQTGNRGKNSTTGDASGDGISTWNTQGSWDGNMVGNGCNADIIYYSRATEGKRDVMMHTLTKSYNSHRKDLRLYMSFDQGATWAEAFQLQPGWAAYSSMQVLDNGDLAIIYEDGSIGNEDKHDCFAINYVTISKETLKARIAELDGPDVTYHIMFNGNEVASNATPEILLKTADAAIPNALKRAFCTYQYYSDAGLTSEITQVGTYQDVYVKCTSSAPFEFSTEVNPKWYLMYSHEQKDDGDYYSYADGSTYNSAIANTNDICANTAYWWAFIGNPYGVQLLNKGQDAYLSAAATFAGSNGARISSAITRNNGSYPNNTFTVYGYYNANVTTSNPFSLVLNESSYAWVNGADIGSANNTGAILYHSGITFNSSLQLNNWRGANLMVREIPSSFDIALNTVGEASYATLYLPYDVQTDGETKAYYIASANNGYAQLTETNNEGRDIPAKTAVVLINSDAESSAHFSVTSEMSSVVDAEDNLLKGTLTSMKLDLSDETPYYSLGRKDGKIGFYKFNNGGTTTIMLGANKAYLATAASGGTVKGFTLDFDDLATDIRLTPTDEAESSMFEGQSSKIYNIAGQRLNKPMKGINIINGQKIVVK